MKFKSNLKKEKIKCLKKFLFCDNMFLKIKKKFLKFFFVMVELLAYDTLFEILKCLDNNNIDRFKLINSKFRQILTTTKYFQSRPLLLFNHSNLIVHQDSFDLEIIRNNSKCYYYKNINSAQCLKFLRSCRRLRFRKFEIKFNFNIEAERNREIFTSLLNDIKPIWTHQSLYISNGLYYEKAITAKNFNYILDSLSVDVQKLFLYFKMNSKELENFADISNLIVNFLHKKLINFDGLAMKRTLSIKLPKNVNFFLNSTMLHNLIEILKRVINI